MNIITKNYESLLPFLVVEAISAQNSYNNMSVKIMDKGWAWLVCGRKLLIWKFKEKSARANIKTQRILSPCFELQLPQSGLIHRADLAHVFFMPQSPNISIRATTVPAALVVSPEGSIRFWSSVANERCTESIVGELQGQEFCTLVPLSQLEYLLGTTTGSVFLLTIDVTAHDSKSILICSPLTTSSGLLLGISRRVTNLFFGPMTSETGLEAKRSLIAVSKYSQSTIDKTGSTERPFFVMSSTFKLRQWSRAGDGPSGMNNLIREWDLQGVIYSKLTDILGQQINFWPIDMITTKSNELLILIVTHDSSSNNMIRYATCVFNPYQAGESLTHLTVLRSHSWRYTNESEEQLLSLRFLERRSTSNVCFVYDRKFLFLVDINEDILDAIDYGNQNDGVLGAGIIDGHPLLFTQRDGLIFVAPVVNNQSRLNDTSIQLEHQPAASNNTFSHSRQENLRDSRIEPMIVEIDEDDDDCDNNQRNQPDVSRTQLDADQSAPNKSLNQSTINKSLDQSRKRETDELEEILSQNKEFEWVQLIDKREYSKASESLAKLAQDCEILKDRKETLIALSKLSELAV